MRDSNYKLVSSNKAAVTITTSLYDRRALDVTSDKPLVNSLNYLTYLVLSLAKVRDTLSTDGGIERLIEILHECHSTSFNINDTLFNGERKLLTAWKWTLAFQCLVLIGTRGTEEIRQKVVKAGILPIIATVLDNYLTLHERSFKESTEQTSSPQFPVSIATAIIEATTISKPFFHRSNNLTSDDYENLSVDQLFKLIKIEKDKVKKSSINNDLKRRYITINIIKKLIKLKLEDQYTDYDMDNNLNFLSDLFLQDYDTNNKLMQSKIAVRNFTESGVVIPRDDDVVWSLQLLAYISKYPYLKDILQNTHLVIDMSIRDKQLKLYLEKQLKFENRPTLIPKSRKGNSNNTKNITKNYLPSASSSPMFSNSINQYVLPEDNFQLRKPTENDLDIDDEESGVDDDLDDSDSISNETIEKDDSLQQKHNDDEDQSDGYLSQLYDSIIGCESINDELFRDVLLYKVNEKINRYIDIECQNLKSTIINKHRETTNQLNERWDYDSYQHFDIDNDEQIDQDDSLIEYKKVNLFPLVEKFTFLTGTDMYYWSGVIMRNSCRRNELKGGVRQCGNLECGKWENYPREFLKCRRCKRTKYCSRECQIRAWHCHRNWCIPSNGSSTETTASTQTENTNLGETISRTNTTLQPEEDAEQGGNDLP